MMSYEVMSSEAYWENRWANSKADGAAEDLDTDEKINAWKALDLLSEYAGFFKQMPPFIGVNIVWGASFFKFMRKGKEGFYHVDAVKHAILGYYCETHLDRHTEEHYNVALILYKVKRALGDVALDNQLEPMIKVICKNTGYDFNQLPDLSGIVPGFERSLYTTPAAPDEPFSSLKS